MNPNDPLTNIPDLPEKIPNRPRGRKGGGKKLPPDEKTILISVYFPPQLHAFIAEYAEKNNVSMSNAVVMMVEKLKSQS